MADQGGSESVARIELPEEAAAWLAEQADRQGVSEEEYLRRLLLAQQSVEAEGEPAVPETLAERVRAVESDLEEKVSDVRERVVQVKRETDTKAPADHDHPDIEEQLRTAVADAEETRSALGELEERVEALQETTEQGFKNYEEILEYLTETTDDIEEKLTRTATALVGTRRVVGELAAAEENRQGLVELLRAANQRGIRVADCEECGEAVALGLLTEPACPHCETAVHGVEPKSGFFGSPTLLTGEPPALEAGEESVEGVETGIGDAAVDTEDAVTALLEDESLAGVGDTETATDGNGSAAGEETDG